MVGPKQRVEFNNTWFWVNCKYHTATDILVHTALFFTFFSPRWQTRHNKIFQINVFPAQQRKDQCKTTTFINLSRRRRKFIEARRRRLEDSSHSNSEASNLLDNADEAESKADQETACTIEQGKACKTDQETACKTDEACKTGQEVEGKTDQEPEAKRKGPPTEEEENLINESQQKSEASVKRRASATSAVKVKVGSLSSLSCDHRLMS